jgi:hypothetical protein
MFPGHAAFQDLFVVTKDEEEEEQQQQQQQQQQQDEVAVGHKRQAPQVEDEPNPKAANTSAT